MINYPFASGFEEECGREKLLTSWPGKREKEEETRASNFL
jgi:hypothetical protein